MAETPTRDRMAKKRAKDRQVAAIRASGGWVLTADLFAQRADGSVWAWTHADGAGRWTRVA